MDLVEVLDDKTELETLQCKEETFRPKGRGRKFHKEQDCGTKLKHQDDIFDGHESTITHINSMILVFKLLCQMKNENQAILSWRQKDCCTKCKKAHLTSETADRIYANCYTSLSNKMKSRDVCVVFGHF